MPMPLRRRRKFWTLNPIFERAKFFIEDIQDLADYEHQGQIKKDIQLQSRRALTESDKARVSWVDEIQYPRNWEELAQHRDEVVRRLGRTGLGEPGVPSYGKGFTVNDDREYGNAAGDTAGGIPVFPE